MRGIQTKKPAPRNVGYASPAFCFFAAGDSREPSPCVFNFGSSGATYWTLFLDWRWFLPFWLVFQNLLPFFIGGFGIAGGGVAYLAHIGGFAVGLATGYLYKKTHSSDFTYGTRYGYKA